MHSSPTLSTLSPMSLTLRAKQFVPDPLWTILKGCKRVGIRSVQKSLRIVGLNSALTSDYYSPLPSVDELAATESQWNKPSPLHGICYDLDAMERRLQKWAASSFIEWLELPPYAQARRAGFGPGYPQVDALILYSMLRELKPSRYLEVGSGLSTYYTSLAAARNGAEGAHLQMECIEPFPYQGLQSIPEIRLQVKKVQEVPVAEFQKLGAGDLLFIDSSHALKIGSDVAFLLLEVLPILQPGVIIHIHDIPFPFNIPYPARFWIFERNWPILWNEAMAVQAFLAFNSSFRIEFSAPLLRHFRESALEKYIPSYPKDLNDDNCFSSLWLVRSH